MAPVVVSFVSVPTPVMLQDMPLPLESFVSVATMFSVCPSSMDCALAGESVRFATIAAVPPVPGSPFVPPALDEFAPQPASAKTATPARKREIGKIALRVTRVALKVDTRCPEPRNLVVKRTPPTLMPTIGGLPTPGNRDGGAPLPT